MVNSRMRNNIEICFFLLLFYMIKLLVNHKILFCLHFSTNNKKVLSMLTTNENLLKYDSLNYHKILLNYFHPITTDCFKKNY